MRDGDVRIALHRELQSRHGADGSLIIDEFGLCHGDARVDVAVINGAISGFEIKSEVDSLARLEGQVDVYSLVLDFACLVTAERHLDAALSLLPDWWAVAVARREADRVVIEELRAGSRNNAVDVGATVELLWRDETFAELEIRDLAHGLKRAPRATLWRELAAAVEPEELGELVRTRLKARREWRRPRPRKLDQPPWWLELLATPP